ncbi:uncharacterized protein LOC117900395 [Drosophila subobscura]|uniref:uncharacterized protein LOC117900395 n=1 Tax=Drosophila subobscura TaxID=7241 RepID=UPI00155A578E|nr:uncharacterized protein LOC117900395 [Drosophila subobscura]
MDPLIDTNNINLRRDLRRKKILDDAKIRLEKLNGRAASRETDLFDNETPTVLYSDPECEPNIQSGRSVFANVETSNASKPSNTSISNKLIKRKVHIFVSSCLGLLIAFYTKGSVFLPVIFCTSLELVFGKYINQNMSAHTKSFFLLSFGTNYGKQIQQLSKILQVIQSILSNLAVTVCVLCTVSFLLLTFNENITVK